MSSRLLVVDDNPAYRRLVRLALENDPAFEVVAEAATAEEALAAATHSEPDTALVDVLLPGGQGFRLLAALREAVPGCVVVLSSAHPEGDLDAMRQLGGVAFLPKSIAPSRLGGELSALVAVADPAQDERPRAEIQLPPTAESARLARRFIEATLESWGCAGLLDTATLLISEVVGNAVLYSGSQVELSARLGPDRLRVEVADRSTSVPHRREVAESDLGGRGSGMIELLAEAWGITGRPDGKTIWFELALPETVT
ncbi:MAG: response regulator [Acidimicrobiales bacterium]